ncbi:unnamed protein product [Blepharisma stoltei]|uniref:Uncharacterized protein n=1 Tax=Blepharisma stoltei TaxID=1481888 RepID=A0AAU9J9W7_9CILI|nr:unnamed protein product [Blepharisma stoltei]
MVSGAKAGSCCPEFLLKKGNSMSEELDQHSSLQRWICADGGGVEMALECVGHGVSVHEKTLNGLHWRCKQVMHSSFYFLLFTFTYYFFTFLLFILVFYFLENFWEFLQISGTFWRSFNWST